MAVPLIAVGLAMFALMAYLTAPDAKKARAARHAKGTAIALVIAGLLIYLLDIVLRFALRAM